MFLGAELPMLREQMFFFINTLSAGLLAEAKLPPAGLTTDGRTDGQFN